MARKAKPFTWVQSCQAPSIATKRYIRYPPLPEGQAIRYSISEVLRDDAEFSGGCHAIRWFPVGSVSQDIWPFESRLLQRAGAILERLQRFDPAHLSVSTLADAARVFVDDMLDVTFSNPNYRTPSYLLERSYNKDTENVRPEIKFEQDLHKIAPPELHAQLLSAFHCYLNASIAASISPMNNQIRPPSNPTPTTSPQHVGGGVRGRVTRETNSTPLSIPTVTSAIYLADVSSRDIRGVFVLSGGALRFRYN
ncbi:hypothetical protein IV203_030428 [Nitzschia inconspicua]|uniref:Uncharacterized protein n=1 Tax=Nitzschia inconspicua TaxID=303405 RepID=A0A9K3K9C1_9STRA|nr:hypothetical protein IV203_025025 [Nitzschia inconspicua]KAG7339016.1 hypothetical protein IV203_028353 [Nitzschia inconspicua]KAG7339860.1 hypothetical protein IV203_024910 [Nitzschia inconspicua]KAG7367757.1 hypothetical protein IV203_030428 [Nitzschia inconspicua]